MQPLASLDMDIRLVDDANEVADALSDLDDAVLGVDVERADGERYDRFAALVQVGNDDLCVALDGVALDDISPLAEHLRGRLAVLHALENDLEPLADAGAVLVPDSGEVHRSLADTSIAAALLGLPLGLSPLLEELLGVVLSADKERFQRADWTQRPLPEDMLAYAAGDVFHLPALWEELAGRLDDAGRRHWYEQELAATAEHALSLTRDWRKTKGAGRLDGHGRAILRSIWEEREEIARAEDLAPQVVLRDDVLVALAGSPPATMNQLSERGVPGRRVGEYGHRMLAAVRRGAESPDVPSLTGHRRSSDEDRTSHDRMRRTRSRVAKEVGLDAGFLCPSRVLWDAVLSDPGSPEELCDAAGLRPWQRELLSDELWSAYVGEEDPEDAEASDGPAAPAASQDDER